MHIIREHEDTLVVAETRADGSVKVKYYRLREYVELSAAEWDSLSAARLRAIPLATRLTPPCAHCWEADSHVNPVMAHACGHWVCVTCELKDPFGCPVCLGAWKREEVPHATQ